MENEVLFSEWIGSLEKSDITSEISKVGGAYFLYFTFTKEVKGKVDYNALFCVLNKLPAETTVRSLGDARCEVAIRLMVEGPKIVERRLPEGGFGHPKEQKDNQGERRMMDEWLSDSFRHGNGKKRAKLMLDAIDKITSINWGIQR